MQRSSLISFLKRGKKEKQKGREKSQEKRNLIVGKLHMVVWLLGSPLLTVSRLNPFSFQTNDKLPYPPFVPLLNITLSSPSKHHPNTLNLVRGIMEEANNESEWWVLEIRGRGDVK